MKRTAMKWMTCAGVCHSLTGICHADPTFGDVMRAAGTYVSPIINPGNHVLKVIKENGFTNYSNDIDIIQ